MKVKNFNVAILGCNYSGMITALSLSAKGILSTVVEKNPCKKEFFVDPKTISINLQSKRFLDEIGVWQGLKQCASPVNDIYVMYDYKSQIIRFNKDELSLDEPLGYMIKGDDFKTHLFSFIKKDKNIRLIKSKGYVDISFFENNCRVSLEDESLLESQLVVVADGKNSMAKKKYFTDFIKKHYKQTAFVFNIWHEKKHENAALEHFLKDGPFATLPLLDENFSAVVWSLDTDLASMYQSLDRDEFTQQVQNKLGDFLGEIKITTRPEFFNLSAQVTNKYFFKNLVLVGDAAHHIHPLAGQGLNLGIKDAQILSEVVDKYLNLGLDVNEIALGEYQRGRKADNLKMFFATDFLNTIFQNQSLSSKILKKVGFTFLNYFPDIKNQIIKTTMY